MNIDEAKQSIHARAHKLYQYHRTSRPYIAKSTLAFYVGCNEWNELLNAVESYCYGFQKMDVISSKETDGELFGVKIIRVMNDSYLSIGEEFTDK